MVLSALNLALQASPASAELGLIAAFKTAFASRDDALLVLKLTGIDHYAPDMAEIRAAIGAAANIRVMTETLSEPELRGLIAASDVVLSLHRSGRLRADPGGRLPAWRAGGCNRVFRQSRLHGRSRQQRPWSATGWSRLRTRAASTRLPAPSGPNRTLRMPPPGSGGCDFDDSGSCAKPSPLPARATRWPDLAARRWMRHSPRTAFHEAAGLALGAPRRRAAFRAPLGPRPGDAASNQGGVVARRQRGNPWPRRELRLGGADL